MGEILNNRRTQATARLEEFKSNLNIASSMANKACVYVTGSFGRAEASQHSDLDLFIVGRGEKDSRELSRLEEISLEAELIRTARELKFPEFSGDGEYLVHHTNYDLVYYLGTREDDSRNILTARLLLLLESKPVVGREVYNETIRQVVDRYFRNHTGHEKEFTPTFLVNDILRLWRTFCVNYESKIRVPESEDDKAKRRLKNYKLRHSRLLTCFSTLIYLLDTYVIRQTISPSEVVTMTGITPTERLESVLDHLKDDARSLVSDILEHYEMFLTITDAPNSELIAKFKNDAFRNEQLRSTKKLGDLTFDAMLKIGANNSLLRVMAV